ncbi:unnamed protein product [Acanthoscelides obtectus]|uniref:Uncharacterized protein n=1 Tax=Acanthoscelides obtectus TaxID=200917 RepID=A0A9P0PLD0_ACAOB|nr:unnamed protein product [Acanthoscelides obtectus]CAK1666285.1 hypothetical protein AOBTE_LOCUS25240 [Acanthoscelides obtectus]
MDLRKVVIVALCLVTSTSMPAIWEREPSHEIEKPMETKPRLYRELVLFETAIFIVGSALVAFITAFLPLEVCFIMGKCQKLMEPYRKQLDDEFSGNTGKIRNRRNLAQFEPYLVAILDSFLQNREVWDSPNKVEVNPMYKEPLLITLAKYFDRYATTEVKRHVKAILFFIVHILGRMYAVVHYFVRYLMNYGLI